LKRLQQDPASAEYTFKVQLLNDQELFALTLAI
jgi:hypothetical protein